jgi:uncharacterized protein UPF0102
LTGLRAAHWRLTIARSTCGLAGELRKLPTSIVEDRIHHGGPQFSFAQSPGEIDLIGWHKDTLCLVEVKTRTSHDVKPAEAAVDREKRRALLAVAREYLRHLSAFLPVASRSRKRLLRAASKSPQVELFRNVPI